jgi:hypothetical protein
MQNLTDEPEMTNEKKASCRLAACHRLDNAKTLFNSIISLLAKGEVNPELFSTAIKQLESAERLATLGATFVHRPSPDFND